MAPLYAPRKIFITQCMFEQPKKSKQTGNNVAAGSTEITGSKPVYLSDNRPATLKRGQVLPTEIVQRVRKNPAGLRVSDQRQTFYADINGTPTALIYLNDIGGAGIGAQHRFMLPNGEQVILHDAQLSTLCTNLRDLTHGDADAEPEEEPERQPEPQTDSSVTDPSFLPAPTMSSLSSTPSPFLPPPLHRISSDLPTHGPAPSPTSNRTITGPVPLSFQERARPGSATDTHAHRHPPTGGSVSSGSGDAPIVSVSRPGLDERHVRPPLARRHTSRFQELFHDRGTASSGLPVRASRPARRFAALWPIPAQIHPLEQQSGGGLSLSSGSGGGHVRPPLSGAHTKRFQELFHGRGAASSGLPVRASRFARRFAASWPIPAQIIPGKLQAGGGNGFSPSSSATGSLQAPVPRNRKSVLELIREYRDRSLPSSSPAHVSLSSSSAPSPATPSQALITQAGLLQEPPDAESRASSTPITAPITLAPVISGLSGGAGTILHSTSAATPISVKKAPLAPLRRPMLPRADDPSVISNISVFLALSARPQTETQIKEREEREAAKKSRVAEAHHEREKFELNKKPGGGIPADLTDLTNGKDHFIAYTAQEMFNTTLMGMSKESPEYLLYLAATTPGSNIAVHIVYVPMDGEEIAEENERGHGGAAGASTSRREIHTSTNEPTYGVIRILVNFFAGDIMGRVEAMNTAGAILNALIHEYAGHAVPLYKIYRKHLQNPRLRKGMERRNRKLIPFGGLHDHHIMHTGQNPSYQRMIQQGFGVLTSKVERAIEAGGAMEARTYLKEMEQFFIKFCSDMTERQLESDKVRRNTPEARAERATPDMIPAEGDNEHFMLMAHRELMHKTISDLMRRISKMGTALKVPAKTAAPSSSPPGPPSQGQV